jgi:hypothetical protein
MTAPYVGGGSYLVSPNDSQDLTIAGFELIGSSGVIFSETGGDIKVTCEDGKIDTFEDVPAYFIIPVRVKRVWATGTVATRIHCIVW